MRLIISLFIVLVCLSSCSERIEPYKGSRIFWDIDSKVTVFEKGNYARMIELQDGRLLCAAESDGICISFSSDKGRTWSEPKCIVETPEKIFLAVPDLIQLKDGSILLGYNPRPREPYSKGRLFGIRAVRSIDNGETWSDPIFIFDAKHLFIDGCWEPSFLELPSGEIQCYFANENEYTNSEEQCISMCRSFDKGLSWSEPVKICFRNNSRDGMPVPVLLKDQSEIAVIIEDNGWPGRGNFAATTVRCALADNWNSAYVNSESSQRDMIFETIPEVGIISAAPYLRVLPNGETVASYQGNEGRNAEDLQYFDMFVEVGDKKARNFKARTTPFALDLNHHSIWNSLAVIDSGIVVAVGSIGEPFKANSIQMIKGYPICQVHANYGNITVDGIGSDAEKWTTINGQLPMGYITKNKALLDFLYNERYLFFKAYVKDKSFINNSVQNDGVRFLIDADDVSGKNLQKGMYSIFFDTNGSFDFRSVESGKWVTNNNAEIEYAVKADSDSYLIEAAIPWNLLGKKRVPFNERMAIAVEIVDKTPTTTFTETIADVDNEASWTWLEFCLL